VSVAWDDLVMQGKSRTDRELWDVGAVTEHVVPAGSVFGFVAEHRRELFPDGFISDLFEGSRTGRPSLSADLVGSVLVLRALFDYSDGQAADALLEPGTHQSGRRAASFIAFLEGPDQSAAQVLTFGLRQQPGVLPPIAFTMTEDLVDRPLADHGRGRLMEGEDVAPVSCAL
jgi:hypothetical protein